VPLTPDELTNLHNVMGRVNALHTFCVVIARSLPPEIATVAATNLSNAYKRVEADAVASPLPEAHLQELLRVTAELQRVLEAATRGP
jgi:hypothetical protein